MLAAYVLDLCSTIIKKSINSAAEQRKKCTKKWGNYRAYVHIWSFVVEKHHLEEKKERKKAGATTEIEKFIRWTLWRLTWWDDISTCNTVHISSQSSYQVVSSRISEKWTHYDTVLILGSKDPYFWVFLVMEHFSHRDREKWMSWTQCRSL